MPGDRSAGRSLWLRIRRNGGLYLLMIPAMIIFICFTYLPMYGIVIAFKNFKPARGILGSEWAGLRYFKKYFSSYMFSNTIRNTLVISIYTIHGYLPAAHPDCADVQPDVRQAVQKVLPGIYLPAAFYLHRGHVRHDRAVPVAVLGRNPQASWLYRRADRRFDGQGQRLLIHLCVDGGLAACGWDSIMYIAALSAVDPQLYEAAVVDGANKWQKMRSIDIPLLMPTAVVLFILRAGSVMSVGFEKVYLLQNDLNISASEIISTYVYKMGLKSNQYSYSAAIGLFNNVVNFILLLSVNFIAGKMGDTSLF